MVKRLGEILKMDCSKLLVAELRERLIEHKRQSLRDEEEEDDISTKMKEVRIDTLRRGTTQRFRYTDDSIIPGTTYSYEISPVHVKHKISEDEHVVSFKRTDTITITFHAEEEEKVANHEHEMYFNRGTAGHQFISKFYLTGQEVETPSKLLNKRVDHPIWKWLGRGLDTSILTFLDGVKRGETVMVALYECAYFDILDKLRTLRERGATVRILVHAQMTWSKTERNFNKSGSSVKNIASLVHTGLFPHKDTTLRRISGKRATTVSRLTTTHTQNTNTHKTQDNHTTSSFFISTRKMNHSKCGQVQQIYPHQRFSVNSI